MLFAEEIKSHIDQCVLEDEEKQKLYKLILYEFYYELHHCIITYDNEKVTYKKVLDLIHQLKKRL